MISSGAVQNVGHHKRVHTMPISRFLSLTTWQRGDMMTSWWRQQVSGRTVQERLYNDLTDDYEDEVDPGAIELQMSIYLLCAWVDNDTGFVSIHGWESYVSIPFGLFILLRVHRFNGFLPCPSVVCQPIHFFTCPSSQFLPTTFTQCVRKKRDQNVF